MIANKSNSYTYFAGYLDGDGCFYLGKTILKKNNRVKYKSAVVVSSTDKGIIKSFQFEYGGFCHLKKLRKKGHRLIYQFVIHGEKALHLTKTVKPFLIEKKEEAQMFCNFIEKTSKTKKCSLIAQLKEIKRSKNLIFEKDKKALNKIIPSSKVIENDFAYLAGFIDAECCLSITSEKPKNKPNLTYKIYLCCNNSKLPIFPWLIEKFGGSIFFIHRKKKNKKHRNQFMWRISGKTLSEILPKIYPFLKYKQPVCKKLMEFYKTILPNGGDRQSKAFKQSYAKVLAKRADIKSQVHLLNAKGCKNNIGMRLMPLSK